MMALSPLRKCGSAGCNSLTRQGRCDRHAKEKKTYDQHRGTATQRGYDKRWSAASDDYRASNPLCVLCLLQGRTRASKLTDHIAPQKCVPSLFWDEDNWAALCQTCHNRKTAHEPKHQWEPDASRVVVCGLPGTGKTTYCKTLGVPYFDADDDPWLITPESVTRARERWIAQHKSGACAVIVASTATAANVAAQLRGVVKHLRTQYVQREVRA